ncbi:MULTISPECIES: ATP phosphoribosyltransferase [unclassified Oceanobacter]|jgi:ATP phosphoribosyltransferase|uniref:ATP phosphoribosyltransferase n=1 Tax=unclassified Oceanobacter TaxID=2620260 RepID=UPI0026E17757|nr:MULTISPECIES: ATP phosphoribosyltransferase [unclassified Oceanobacter]MDO6681973.1 ATP phosphoribosyltransferase [Oceanobacter sp. 5_MG-2023]MDP2505335.1 ATP phosphoribosyltransferase [Oceanobacter sp. 3_MG-2023]MDP2548009.1 ATP phosphoribosyltransferase [Oceanobacter sp. 4_MG-2023]MDP2610137.1 ATP phosphoribosyltransferase [Oceanobacter sp. 1_MG-2023]MDP2612288.1 ATP phosphoribosyltransferase [Oceanobacter sp. 2_MG-2023]
MTQPLTIALSKGRILDDTLPLLAEAGIHPAEDIQKSRKLIFDTNHPHIKLVVIRATDVPTYVEYGAADLGVSGKDVLMEYNSDNLCEPLDLNIATCRLMTAAIKGTELPEGRLKVATKFVNVTKRYFAEQGRQVDIIKLYGGMELAPIMGLADLIVDIVDTGNTLKANGLEARDLIAPVSSRLVASRAAMKVKHAQIQPIIDLIGAAVERQQQQAK